MGRSVMGRERSRRNQGFPEKPCLGRERWPWLGREKQLRIDGFRPFLINGIYGTCTCSFLYSPGGLTVTWQQQSKTLPANIPPAEPRQSFRVQEETNGNLEMIIVITGSRTSLIRPRRRAVSFAVQSYRTKRKTG